MMRRACTPPSVSSTGWAARCSAPPPRPESILAAHGRTRPAGECLTIGGRPARRRDGGLGQRRPRQHLRDGRPAPHLHRPSRRRGHPRRAGRGRARTASASGPFLDAVVVGYEVAVHVGLTAGRGHYRTWYPTATCGVFGAAAGGGGSAQPRRPGHRGCARPSRHAGRGACGSAASSPPTPNNWRRGAPRSRGSSPPIWPSSAWPGRGSSSRARMGSSPPPAPTPSPNASPPSRARRGKCWKPASSRGQPAATPIR